MFFSQMCAHEIYVEIAKTFITVTLRKTLRAAASEIVQVLPLYVSQLLRQSFDWVYFSEYLSSIGNHCNPLLNLLFFISDAYPAGLGLITLF